MAPKKPQAPPAPNRKDPAGIRGPEQSGTIGAGTGSTGKGEAKPEPKTE